ncbi:MAG: ubiquinone biosynthesis protein UbiH [Burkholderiales bacterium PBB4]|nr:MAG: ubiquinone biosynthesis protein UbiH [Burkholderiales bacterium PBB4]
MAKTFDICVRGAGIVGRALALQLAAKQLRVALVTSSPAAALLTDRKPDIRAYALNLPSRKVLESVRCWPDSGSATPVLAMKVMGQGGGQVSFHAAEQGQPALNWIVDVPALEDQLAQAVRFQPLIEVVNAPVPAALNIVCEGKASQTREELGVQTDVTPYPQWAIACRIRSAVPHQQIAQQWFEGGDVLAFLPLEGEAGNLCAVVWSVSPERAQELCQWTPEDFCQALERASHAPEGTLSLEGERASWPLQHAVAQRWSGVNANGAWVLAGDAAHTVHPLAGQGLNLGLADVAELVQILTTRPYWRSVGDPKLLRQYERARKAEFAMLGQANDALQQVLTHAHPALQSLRNWGMNRFDQSGPLKHWVADRAMGASGGPRTTD